MAEHRLKTWPPFFRAVAEGRKTFEARRDDRGFDVGDVLVLCEFDPAKLAPFGTTGREVRVEVTYILRGGDFGVERGWVVLAIRPQDTGAAPQGEKP